jgi:hypothetical protein
MISNLKEKAITAFVNTFGGSFKKLDPLDVDYRIMDKLGNLIAYAEVRPVPTIMRYSYPLPVEAKKVVKLIDKRIVPVIIWTCDDGIIYGKANKIRGEVKWGSIAPNNNLELIIYYDKQKDLKYIRFTQ